MTQTRVFCCSSTNDLRCRGCINCVDFKKSCVGKSSKWQCRGRLWGWLTALGLHAPSLHIALLHASLPSPRHWLQDWFFCGSIYILSLSCWKMFNNLLSSKLKTSSLVQSWKKICHNFIPTYISSLSKFVFSCFHPPALSQPGCCSTLSPLIVFLCLLLVAFIPFPPCTNDSHLCGLLQVPFALWSVPGTICLPSGAEYNTSTPFNLRSSWDWLA